MEPLTLAIPTGRLFPEAVALLQRLRLLDAPPPERALVLPGPEGGRILVAKPLDILTYVEHGAADAGIVGQDLLLEQEADVYELADLGFGACRAVVAVPAGREALLAGSAPLRVATRYPRVTARFFEQARRPVEVIVLHGALELAPQAGLADAIVDLVMTGRTLRANRLVEVAEVFRSTARLVVNRVSLRLKAPGVRALLEAVAPAVQAT